MPTTKNRRKAARVASGKHEQTSPASPGNLLRPASLPSPAISQEQVVKRQQEDADIHGAMPITVRDESGAIDPADLPLPPSLQAPPAQSGSAQVPPGRRRRRGRKAPPMLAAAPASPATALTHVLSAPVNSSIQDTSEPHHAACLTLAVLARMVEWFDRSANQIEGAGDEAGQASEPARRSPGERCPSVPAPRRGRRSDAPAGRAASCPAGHLASPAAAGKEDE